MKKKIVLTILLLLVFLVASYASVGAKTGTRVTGSMNYPMDPSGWGWGQLNFIIDPDTGNADGFAKFAGYFVDKPKDFSWYASAVCGDIGFIDGNPAVVVVFQLEEATDFTVGHYMKFLIVDGGQNASKDMMGLIWPFPSAEPFSCSFESTFMDTMGVGGNITIH